LFRALTTAVLLRN